MSFKTGNYRQLLSAVVISDGFIGLCIGVGHVDVLTSV
ncbi:hypothetical protein GPAL_1511 [Glaciecola pallidula DSM 14239 = ACAM 615]|uniref:Uncharacterized protein n=1 Tax=Brumicola pallidula DSM 14239 = ACAM 615 TaxID=1121922 RepID=K6ZHK8_9ALTE|nr:hypothetical protein GPAL_1511 [Glaciecola pallidula DSM 14239 = ACAM 615]